MQLSFTFALLLVVLLLVVGPPAAQEDGPMPVIIDTDMAVDDWMAILYLLQHPDVNVLAVTVSGTGEAHCEPGIRNAMNLLALAGNPEIPLACGRETPLLGTNVFPTAWRTGVDAMMGIDLPQNPNPPLETGAVDLLRQTISESPEDVTLVTLGPVTTIAELLQADPALTERIAMIYVMGGAVDVPGNVFQNGNTTAEWNIFVDPLAAAQMVESGVPVTFIPLDATNSAPLTMQFYDRLNEDRTTAEAEFVFQAVSSQIGFAESGMWYFWDPMAAAVATDESLVTLEDRTVVVVTEEGPEFGRVQATDDGYPVRVAVNADGARFEQLFLNVLNGR